MLLGCCLGEGMCGVGTVSRAGGLGGPGFFFGTGRQGWPGGLRTWGYSWGGARCRQHCGVPGSQLPPRWRLAGCPCLV